MKAIKTTIAAALLAATAAAPIAATASTEGNTGETYCEFLRDLSVEILDNRMDGADKFWLTVQAVQAVQRNYGDLEDPDVQSKAMDVVAVTNGAYDFHEQNVTGRSNALESSRFGNDKYQTCQSQQD